MLCELTWGAAPGFHSSRRWRCNESHNLTREFHQVKLDWIWLRNLEESGHGVNRRVELSDHWPLWVVLRTKNRRALRLDGL
jgi:endonuclease/exonuclease/phosphatase (EEP) superfamily protein YafD